MKQFIFILVISFFTIDTTFAQSDYEVWLKKRNEEYADFLHRYDDWNSKKREEYAHWKAQHAGSPAVQQPQVAAPAMKVWVVIVGVAKYAHEGISDLTYTKDDAYRMYSFYKSVEGGSLPDEQITLLLDMDAVRRNLAHALVEMCRKAGKDDAIIFYFSGHGLPGAFVLHEFGSYESIEGLLLHSELANLFDGSPAKYKYIIADACHSGSLAETAADKGTKSKSATGSYYQAFEKAKKGFVMMLSSMKEETSLEIGGLRQGLFSYYLIQGLNGNADTNKDMVVSVTELYDYVDLGVNIRSDGRQTPVLAGDYDDSMPIAIVRARP